MANSDSPSTVVDVAIVGGGVAGAYTAYRLKRGKPKSGSLVAQMLARSGADELDIRLIELGDRIGGRLWSYRVPEIPDQPVDLGGMGFSELQQNVYGLCTRELKLKTSTCDFFNQQLLQYLRRRRFSSEEYSQPGRVPYDLDPDEQGKDPGVLMVEAVAGAIEGSGELLGKVTSFIEQGDLPNALKAINELTRHLRTATVTGGSACTGMPLYKVGFWNLMADVLSIEAYHLCSDSAFDPSCNLNWNLYDSFLALVNVLSYFALAGATGHSPFTRLDNGYDELPKRLIEVLKEEERRLNTRLYRVVRKELGGESVLELTIGSVGDGARETLHARSVVLAMPRRSLSLLDDDSVIFEGATFADDLNAVRPIPASKVFTVYDRQWWREIDNGRGKIGNGYSTTDLPMKACYYVSPESAEKGLLLASYADAEFAQFWDGYALHYYHAGDMAQLLPAGTDRQTFAPQDMIAELQRQLTEMHGCDSIPDPIRALHVNWSRDPFGGGYHNWNPHYRSWEVMPRIRKPVADADVFICGEAYSAVQGWVEGALNTAEMVAGEHFGLERPDWVLPEYEFGP